MNNSKRPIRSMLLHDYMDLVAPTDFMPSELRPVLFGLYGEVGSVMAASKKLHREKGYYHGFHSAAVEEFGDVLWYLSAVCRRLGIRVSDVFTQAISSDEYGVTVAANDHKSWPLAIVSQLNQSIELDPALLSLGQSASGLLSLNDGAGEDAKGVLIAFAHSYIKALQASGIAFGEVAEQNVAKTRGKFVDADPTKLPTFDGAFGAEERLPDTFEIVVSQRKGGKSNLQWNGVFIGDPLTDNISDEDGYRFHDVFHLAHAAVLHWSPVFRAMIKHKRKSNPQIDESEDGGRAIVIEEGLSAWIFSQAKEIGFFAGRDKISWDLLKTVEKFVRGYEVEVCPLKLWEQAILQGYSAFVRVKRARWRYLGW